jgi:4-hydroxy-tetrahydrodipicolinate synthase
MVQDAPISGVTLSVPFLVRMAREIGEVRLCKIETAQAGGELRARIEAGGEAIEVASAGEEAITLMADLDAGATGTMTSATLPDLIGPAVRAYLAGDRATAAATYNRLLPLINFENRQCGWRSCKVVMKEGGVIGSEALRHPTRPLHPETRAQLLELAREVEPVALRWGR